MVYVIQVCWQLASRIRTEFSPDPARKLSPKPVWHIPLLCIQWKTPGDGQRNCPKHVEFYSENKFEKIVHVVGFIIRIYHDARSRERQNWLISAQELWRCLAKIRITVGVLLERKTAKCLSGYSDREDLTQRSYANIHNINIFISDRHVSGLLPSVEWNLYM